MMEAERFVLGDEGAALVAGLVTAERALAEHRIADAAAAIAQVADRCVALEAAGLRLPEPIRARAREVHESCVAASEAIVAELRVQLQQAGTSRRAGAAYQGRRGSSK